MNELYFVSAEVHSGDATGPTNMDLFVLAGNVSQAVNLWKKHYDDWDMPDEHSSPIVVYLVPIFAALEREPGPIIWDSLEKHEIGCEDGGPVVCPGCGSVEGSPEWGTVGDGFDGYCPSCADKRDVEDDNA